MLLIKLRGVEKPIVTSPNAVVSVTAGDIQPGMRMTGQDGRLYLVEAVKPAIFVTEELLRSIKIE